MANVGTHVAFQGCIDDNKRCKYLNFSLHGAPLDIKVQSWKSFALVGVSKKQILLAVLDIVFHIFLDKAISFYFHLQSHWILLCFQMQGFAAVYEPFQWPVDKNHFSCDGEFTQTAYLFGCCLFEKGFLDLSGCMIKGHKKLG